MTLPLVRFVRTSKNQKTGPIPVTSTAPVSCSPVCPFNLDDNGNVKTEQGKLPSCYAGFGNTAIHWRNLSGAAPKGNVLEYADFIKQVRALPDAQLWRHNEAGDIPHDKGAIDSKALQGIVRANKGKRGFTYTHHRLDDSNRAIIERANSEGFTVNVSANNIQEAIAYKRQTSAPVVAILPIDAPNTQTVQGVKVVACPAEKSDRVTCYNCGLCQENKRDYVIGFRAHGTNKKKTDIIARGA